MKGRVTWALGIAEASSLLAGTLLWTAFRRGWLSPRPKALAAVAVLLLTLLLLHLALLGWAAFRDRRKRLASIGQAGCLVGLLIVGVSGLANWLFHLQGAVVLNELEAVPLSMTAHFQNYDAGPLVNLEELGLTLQLERLSLRSGPDEALRPESRLRVQRQDGTLEQLVVSAGKAAVVGPVRFHQGAFGFAPRVVIQKGALTIFDEQVPFVTAPAGQGAWSFEGAFTLAKEDLAVRGAVDLTSLDERLRGHERLVIEVQRGEITLGRGALLPGHFAEIEGGYRVGFAGLKKWSEIDLSRRNYAKAMLGGAVLAALGGIGWLAVVLWARRKR